jgi:Methyltransferase domain
VSSIAANTHNPLTADLRSAPPALHGDSEYWGLGWPALAWLERNVTADMNTLETGAGASTLVFAAAGSDHEVITPSEIEAHRIERQARERGLDSDRIQFHIGSSHEVLPKWASRPLDLVLVDGAHGFPYPIIDWWHLAPHVRVGGLMLIDDAYMPPVAALLDYLRSSKAWEIVETLGYRTVVVRKLAEELPDFDWAGERIGGRMSFRYLPAGRRAVASARHRTLSSSLGMRLLSLMRRPTGLRFSKRG